MFKAWNAVEDKMAFVNVQFKLMFLFINIMGSGLRFPNFIKYIFKYTFNYLVKIYNYNERNLFLVIVIKFDNYFSSSTYHTRTRAVARLLVVRGQGGGNRK